MSFSAALAALFLLCAAGQTFARYPNFVKLQKLNPAADLSFEKSLFLFLFLFLHAC